MTDVSPSPKRPLAAWGRVVAIGLTGSAATTFVQLGMARLAETPLSRAGYGGAGVVAAIAAVLGTSARLRSWAGMKRRFARLGLLAIAAGALWLAARATKNELSLFQAAYEAGLSALIFSLLEAGAARSREEPVAERIRLLLIGVVAVGAILPYLSDLFIGRLDARWYAYMFRDFLDQWRSGSLPVFIGQGEFGFNGGVHPFRTAPWHMYLGGALDWLTLRQLSALALEHATVVFSALAGGYGMYVGLTALGPRARWRAMLAAALYVLCPGVLAPIYGVSMYMTFMAVAGLPLVMVGNALTCRRRDPNYVPLAIGLAIVWFCHPPVAFWCALLTAVVQIGNFMAREDRQGRWKPAIAGGLLFGGLALYYFVAMAEVPLREPLPLGRDFLQLSGLVLVVVGVAAAFDGLRWTWLAVIACGLGILGWTEPAWYLWAALAIALIWLGVVLAQVLVLPLRDWRWEMLLAGFFIGATLLSLALPNPVVGGPFEPMHNLVQNREKLGVVIRPIRIGAHYRWPEFQLGWSLLLGLCWIGALAFSRRFNQLRWLVVPALALVTLQFPVPAFSDFYVAYFPPALAKVLWLASPQRELPILAALAVVGGFLAVVAIGRRSVVIGGTLLLGIGVLWSAFECRAFYRLAKEGTFSRDVTAELFKPENLLVYPYAYDLLPLPRYFHTGRIDWRMESRLLDARGSVLIGPREIAHEMADEPARTVAFYPKNDVSDAYVIPLVPPIRVAAHQRLLLELDRRDSPARGQILLTGTHFFNENMPGMGWHAEFDEIGEKSGVISIVNSSDAAEDVGITFLGFARQSTTKGAKFASGTVIRYDDAKNPIRLESSIPYRVEVHAPVDSVLETPRVFLPGYRASVDGRVTEVLASREKLVAVDVPAGAHTVEISYVGTTILWWALFVSGTTWSGLIVFLSRRMVHRRSD